MRHVRINGFEDRVTMFNMAAVDKTRPVALYLDHRNSGHPDIFSGMDSVQVPGKTIDSLNLAPIDVCKMDIDQDGQGVVSRADAAFAKLALYEALRSIIL